MSCDLEAQWKKRNKILGNNHQNNPHAEISSNSQTTNTFTYRVLGSQPRNSFDSQTSSSRQPSSSQSQSNSRQQSPNVFQRSISPSKRKHFTTKFSLNKNLILIFVLSIFASISYCLFIYNNNENRKYCNGSEGQERVNGCRFCPINSINCSDDTFECFPSYIKHKDGYCVEPGIYEIFSDLRNQLHSSKTISFHEFVENFGNRRDPNDVSYAIDYCTDVIFDGDSIQLIEREKDYNLLFISLAFLLAIVIFTIDNYSSF